MDGLYVENAGAIFLLIQVAATKKMFHQSAIDMAAIIDRFNHENTYQGVRFVDFRFFKNSVNFLSPQLSFKCSDSLGLM